MGRLRQIEVGLERLRWLPRNLPADLQAALAQAKAALADCEKALR